MKRAAAILVILFLALSCVSSYANGDSTLALSYTKTAKGLAYTHGSAKAGLRYYPPYGSWPVSVSIFGIPNNAIIEKAYVYFITGYVTAGPPTNPVLYFRNSQNVSQNITPVNIGVDGDKCWGEVGNVTFRADVTNYISGNGTYVMSSNTKDSATDGFTLLIIYRDPTVNYTGSIYLNDGTFTSKQVKSFKVDVNVPDTVVFARGMAIFSDIQDTTGTAATLSLTDNQQLVGLDFSRAFWNFEEVQFPLLKGTDKVIFDINLRSSDCYAWCLAGMYFRMADTPVSIAEPFIDSFYCPADTFYLQYDIISRFQPNNQFKVILSDSMGNFSNGIVIGTKNSDIAGTVKCVIPPNTLPGTNYKLRIVSSSPVDSIGNNDKKIRISKYPLPPLIMSNSPVCEGMTMFLYDFSLDNAQGYTWTGPNNFKMTLRNPNLDDVPLTAGGKYVLFKENYSCGIYDTVDMVIKPRAAKPVMTITGSVCEGDSIRVTALSTTPNITYNLQTPVDFMVGLTAVDTVFKPVSILDSGLYRVVASLDGCLSLIDSGDGIVYRVPSLAPLSNSPLCAGNTIELKANDTTLGAEYLWLGPSGFSSPYKDPVIGQASGMNTGTYLVVANVHFCTDTDSVKVVVKPLPPIPVAGNNGPVCEGIDVELYTTDSSIGQLYSWSGPAGFTSGEKSAIIANTKQAMSGKYAITADLDGCITSDTTMVLIKLQPPLPYPFNNGPLQHGEKIRLNVSNPLIGAFYTWRGPKDFISDVVDPQIDSMTEEKAGTYTVRVDMDGCADSNITELVLKVVVKDQYFEFYPNPNNGNFTINAKFLYDQEVPVSVTNALGQVIYDRTFITQDKVLTQDITLPAVADGYYYLRLTFNDATTKIPFVIRY